MSRETAVRTEDARPLASGVERAPVIIDRESDPEDLPVPVSVIEPPGGYLSVDWAELWRYRDLLRFLVWRDIKVRRRDDAGDALRSSPHHAGALNEMVLAQGLGNADRQAPRAEEGGCSPGTSIGRDHAPHLD